MSERMPRRRGALVVAICTVVAAALSACTAAPEQPADESTFVTPAPPDGSSATGGAGTPMPEQEATAADVAFIEAMIVHHEQAVELAELAADRAADAELAELAARMRVTQAAEAEAMRSWLDRRRTRDQEATAHDHDATMPGEISRSTLDRAAELDGAAFDELFLAAMVPHHRGAVAMSEARLAQPGDPAVARWARAIATAQSIEIDRLLEIEQRLTAAGAVG
ncbi:DUF305 domain-containing protein [Agromyces bauzanensis]